MTWVERFDRECLWRYRATLIRVIDGDTLVALVDTGFFGRHEVHVRIAGLFAPEMSSEGGEAARDALSKALEPMTSPWGLRVITRQRETVISEVRSFERYVADVFLVAADGALVDVKDLL
jgi:endonuclease YncB( thermonuclease family)